METVDDALVSFSKLYHNICGSRSDNLNSEATQDSLPRISLQAENECDGKITIDFSGKGIDGLDVFHCDPVILGQSDRVDVSLIIQRNQR